MAGGLLAIPQTVGALSVTPSNWTVYHGQPAGSGQATSPTPLAPLSPAWTSARLDGQLYGEPLVFDNVVYVATENDSVYALSARGGRILWRAHLGSPVPSGDLPCGDIAPTVGVTGTPVIDPARHELFVVADERHGGSVRHELYGLDLEHKGAVELAEHVDPPGTTPPAQLQRTGLNLDNGEVVFGFGGNAGDCSTYHGFVVGVPETGGPLRTFEVDALPGDSQGAVWMGGAAPEVDQHGNVWAAAGNGSVNDPKAPYDDSDSVLELSPTLRLEHFFAPRTWASDNGNDYDLGSSAPALLSNGLAVQAGKSHKLYLLEQAKLGGIGGQRATLRSICQGDVDGGTAVAGATAYLPCGSGLVAVTTSVSPHPAVKVLWPSFGASGGPPVVGGRYLYTESASSGNLYVVRRGTGHEVQQLSLGSVADHFPTPTVADGLVLAISADRVHAFKGPDGLP